ncbi:MAG: SIMPL domain-containing protein [Leptolyngbya sp. DLM2.Bin15]|nr:MAG: SIMPL domain-containing protein [Leptolyngbya sp. DLM2.Bin15]TVQ16804.1 MAG: SIMPL domain-containing protein [Leptolyngbya sp. DLM2.Bin15]
MKPFYGHGLSLSVTAAIATVLGLGLGQVGQAATPAESALPAMEEVGISGPMPQSWLESEQIAQLLYPPVSNSPGLMVVGQGVVRRPADSVKISMSFYRSEPYYDYYGWEEGGEAALPPPAEPLTEAALRPITNAIIATGVPATAIDVDLSGGGGLYGSTNTASVIVTLRNPSQTQVRNLVTAVNDASIGTDIYNQGVFVNYSVDNCASLLEDVYISAIQDARSRATTMASALGVEIEAVPSVAESPFNLFYPPCDPEQQGQASSLWGGYGYGAGTYYDPSMPAEVQVQRDIFVTFPIRD